MDVCSPAAIGEVWRLGQLHGRTMFLILFLVRFCGMAEHAVLMGQEDAD